MKHYFYSGLLACGLITALASAQTDGTLDPLFGSNGQVLSSFGVSSFQSAEGHRIAIQPDGKIVMTGTILIAGIYYMPVARFNSDGTPDASFGTNGVNLSVSGAIGQALVIQPDGKIVVCGYAQNTNIIILNRFNNDGSLDTTFNMTQSIVSQNGILSIALQNDGKIVVGTTISSKAVIMRYNSDGSLDTTFNEVDTNFGFIQVNLSSILLQNDGKIVMVGYVDSGLFLAARFLSNGLTDTSFGAAGGFATVTISGQSFGYAGAIQADGKIVLVGTSDDDTYFGFARLTSEGLLDNSFGTKGVVITTIPGFPGSAAIQSDGKILFAGSGGQNYNQPCVGRYTVNGQLDTSFGHNGLALGPVLGFSQYFWTAINAQGAITTVSTAGNFALLSRYTCDSLRYSPLSQAVWERYYNQQG